MSEEKKLSGYEKLLRDVERDCNDKQSCGCFNPNGCDKENQRISKYGEPGYKSCFHAYCDKFKWIIDRAKQYGEVLGHPWEEILDEWENQRSYWYMNFYQECNQPELGKDTKYFDSPKEFFESIGDKGYICPNCKKITKNAIECDNKGCDWKAYGLFFTGTVVSYIKGYGCQRHFVPVAWKDLIDKEKTK